MNCTGAPALGTSSPPTAAVPSHDAAPVPDELRQQQCLRLFALADLLGVSSATNQQMSVVTKTPCTSLGFTCEPQHCYLPHTTARDCTMHAHPLEKLLVGSVVQRLLDRCPGANVRIDDIYVPIKNLPSAIPSVSKANQQPVRKQQASSLTAVPWAVASSQSQCSLMPTQQTNRESLLPPVLCHPQGVARIEELHSTFLPLLLVELLEHASGRSGEHEEHITGSASPRHRGSKDTGGCEKRGTLLSPQQRRSCREALQTLFPLYMPLLRKRRRAVCGAVNATLEALQMHSCGHQDGSERSTEGEEKWRHIYHLLHRDLCNREVKQWLYAVGHLFDTLVKSLSHVSHGVRVAPASPALPAGGVAEDEDALMEARWALEMAGTWLREAGTLRQDGVPGVERSRLVEFFCGGGTPRKADVILSTDAEQLQVTNDTLVSVFAPTHPADSDLPIMTDKVLALAEVVCTVVDETRADAPPFDAASNQVHGERKDCSGPCESATSSLGNADTRALSMLRDFLAVVTFGQPHTNICDPFPTLLDPKAVPGDPQHRHKLLLAERLEREQTQQYRLLAAAKQAVQHILLQQHRQDSSALWRSPEMVVASCSVTALQLHIQMHRHEQHMTDLLAASPSLSLATVFSGLQRNARRLSCPGRSPAADPERLGVHDEAHESPRTCEPHSAGAAQTAQLGEIIWLNEEDGMNAIAQLTGHQERQRAPSVRESKNLEHAVSPSFTPDVVTSRSSAAAAADTAASRPLSPSPSTLVSSAPSALPVFPSLPCLSRSSSSSSIPMPHNQAARSAMNEEKNEVPVATEKVEYPARSLNAPARMMEGLWKLPVCVPRDWTPALATLMACCSLCLTSSLPSVAAPRPSVVTGVHSTVTTNTITNPATATASAAVEYPVSSSTEKEASGPRSTARGFSPNGRHELSAAITSSRSVRSSSSVCNKSTTTSVTGMSTAAGSVYGGSGSADTAMAVGALAQWHLRGLIQQLRLPTNGRLPPSGQAGASSRRGIYASAPNTRSAGVSLASSLPVVGDALCQLDPVSLLASCFSLMHLLQTQPHFFEHAKLSGRAMLELQLGVLEARWGSEQGFATEALRPGDPAASRGASPSPAKACASRLGGAPADGFTGSRSLWNSDHGTAVEEVSLDSPFGLDEGNGDVNDKTLRVSAEAPANRPGHAATTSACALTEALLVAVSFVGCRTLATMQRQVAPTDVHREEMVDPREVSCEEQGLSINVSYSPLPSRDLWAEALQAIAGLLLEAHRAHKKSCSAVRRARSMVVAAAVANSDRSRSRTHSYSALQPLIHPVDKAGTLSPTVPGVTGLILPASTAPTSACGPQRQLSDPRGASSLGTISGLTHTVTTSTAPPMSSPLSTEAQFGIGSFFVALARAVLQLHASSTAAEVTTEENPHQHNYWPPRLLCVAQCLYAVASIIDDLLHDYTNGPPSALCNILATMSVTLPQLPSASLEKACATVPSPSASAKHSVWDALHVTPFWNDALLGSLEYASRAWAFPEDGYNRTGKSRHPLSSKDGTPGVPRASHDPQSRQRICPPWQSLLGHIPCLRDPFVTSWLPLALRGPSRSSPRWTLLALLATEEDLSLAKLVITKRGCTARAAPAMTDSAEVKTVPTTNANTEHDFRLAGVCLVSSARYVQWMETLCDAWRL